MTSSALTRDPWRVVSEAVGSVTSAVCGTRGPVSIPARLQQAQGSPGCGTPCAFLPLLRFPHSVCVHVNGSVVSNSATPRAAGHQVPVHERILEWVAISFSRGIFPTQGWNWGLLTPGEPPGKLLIEYVTPLYTPFLSPPFILKRNNTIFQVYYGRQGANRSARLGATVCVKAGRSGRCNSCSSLSAPPALWRVF